jgi:hypothetical protein
MGEKRPEDGETERGRKDEVMERNKDEMIYQIQKTMKRIEGTGKRVRNEGNRGQEKE